MADVSTGGVGDACINHTQGFQDLRKKNSFIIFVLITYGNGNILDRRCELKCYYS